MPDDTFVLTSIPFDSPGSINLAAGNVLQITEGGTTYNLHLGPTQNFIGDFFHLVSDGGSGTLVTEDATPPPPPPPSLGQSPVVLNDFGWAQGWGGAVNPRLVADANGDGTSDYIGFGYSSTFIAYGGTFSNGASTGPGFTAAGPGFRNERRLYRRRAARRRGGRGRQRRHPLRPGLCRGL